MFKVGDEVLVSEDYPKFANKIGIVRSLLHEDFPGVDFGNDFKRGHDLAGELKTSSGWFVPQEFLQLTNINLENK